MTGVLSNNVNGTGGTYTIQFPGTSTAYTYTWEPVSTTFNTTVQDITSDNQSYTGNICNGNVPTNGQWFTTSMTNNDVLEVKSITLPDGLQYGFTYDPATGLVNGITYPTGATVSYTWGDNPDSEVMGFVGGNNGAGADLYPVPGSAYPSSEEQAFIQFCYFRHDLPVITKRVVSYDGVHPSLEQDFTYVTTWATQSSLDWTTKSTTVITKNLAAPGTPSYKTVYNYVRDTIQNQVGFTYTSSKPTESTVLYYDTTGSLLKTTTKVWAGGQQGILIAECETLNTGAASGKFYEYATWPPAKLFGLIYSGIIDDAVTDVAEYDYGAVDSSCTRPAAVPSRETATTYATFANTPLWPTITVNGTSVPNPYILDRPATVKVYDHGSLIAETDYGYDQTAVSAVSPDVIGHDETNYGQASTLPRGNATTITKKCFTGSQSCTNSVVRIAYDETGQPVTVTGANGNVTNLSYIDNYTSDDGTPSSVPCVPGGATTCSNTNTYLTQINHPTTANGVSHVEKFQWDFNKGELRVAWDENNQASYYYYNDPWNRLTQSTFPDGGQITHSYSDAGPNPSVTTTQLMVSPGESKRTVQVMDQVGHPVQTQVTSDPSGTIYADSYYDGLGQVYQSSTPYRSQTEATYGLTLFSYDALGRRTLQTNPDSTTLHWCYNGLASLASSACRSHIAKGTGEWVDSTDENGNSWQRTYNALGQLTSVIEPSGSSQAPVMETDYGYNALNDLLSAVQWGGASGSQGARSRSFSYNSLSQLLAAQNPESGTVSYGYDPNGNLTTRTREVWGRALHTTRSIG
jgi:YD repeat-containing protein